MSLSALTIIYESIYQWLGTTWLAWGALAIAMVALFMVLLRINLLVLIMVLSIPFLLLLAASVIVIPYGWAILSLVFGTALAIGLYRLFVK